MFADYKTFNLIFWFIKSSWFTIHCPLTINLAILNRMQILQNGPWHLNIVGMLLAFTLNYAQLLEIQIWRLFPDLMKQFRYYSLHHQIYEAFHLSICIKTHLKLAKGNFRIYQGPYATLNVHWIIFYISITSSMFANNNKVVIYSSC